MVSILAHAQNLVYTLLSLMPSAYQQENLEAMLGLFLQAQGCPLPEHSKSKSASALGVYRWLVLSLISYILAHWAYLSTTMAAPTSRTNASTNLPNWGQAAEIAFQTIFPHLVVYLILQDIERLRELALSQGIDILISRCKI